MKKTLSIVIPVFNESERLAITFNGLKKKIDWGIFDLKSIIFVDDGSRDNTKKIIKENTGNLESELNTKIILISYKVNMGKGFAVKRGMQSSNSDYTLMMDADMSTPLTELVRFQASAKNDIPVIIGTRKSKIVRVVKEQSFIRRNMGKVFTKLSQIILNTWVTDFTCGFKVFSLEANRAIFSRAQINRWGYDSEILFLANHLGFKIKEIAVKWTNDDRSRVSLFRDSVNSFLELIQIRLKQISGAYNLPKEN